MDKRDLKIIELLRENSRHSWKVIGQHVHLTGQAVASRVQKLLEAGHIRQFTIKERYTPRYWIGVQMLSQDFRNFEAWLHQHPHVISADKVTGQICYCIEFQGSNNELQVFLENLLTFGRYQILSVVKPIK